MTDVMLRNYVFVQVVSTKISATAFERLMPLGKIIAQGGPALRFKHYNMRINLSDHDCTNPVKCVYLLPGLAIFIDFCERVQLDDYGEATWSLTRLRWLIQFCPQNRAIQDQGAIQNNLLSVIGEKWRNFEYFAIVNAGENLARKIEGKVRSPRWTSFEHFIGHNKHMCRLGASAFTKGDLALALQYFRPVHYGLSSTRATTQVLEWKRSLLSKMFHHTHIGFYLWSSGSLSSIYILLLQSGNLDIARQFEGPNLDYYGLCVLAEQQAGIAVTAAEAFKTDNWNLKTHLITQAHLRHAVALRMLGSNFEDQQKDDFPKARKPRKDEFSEARKARKDDFSEVQKVLAKVHALSPKNPYLKVEKMNLVRAIARKPALPNEIPWAEGLKVVESMLALPSHN